MLVVNEKISIPLKEFSFTYARSPGPGGQNVNKVNSKVILRWPVGKTKCLPETVRSRLQETYSRRFTKTGDLVLSSHRFRDQGRNVADCMNKLRDLVLSVADEPKSRKKTKPTKAAGRRRLENKRRVGDRKHSRRNVRLDD